jgi:uncharacterized protein (DUF1684 family)
VLIFAPETPEVPAVSLATTVAAIFESPRAARIHFRLGRLEISPQRLRGVGKAINKDPAYSSIGARQKTSGHGLHAR